MADAAAGARAGALLERYLPVLPSLAGGDDYSVRRAEPLDSGQRNTVARVMLSSAARDLACIVKFYLPSVDRFFDHHFRREEKVLNLLNRFFPGRAPEVFGGLLVENRVALLLMEDLGCESLEARLQRTSGAAQRDLIALGVEMLVDFHTVTLRHYQPFYRTIQSIDLDRLNAPTLLRRFEVAVGRVWHVHTLPPGDRKTLPVPSELPALARAALPPAFLPAYRRQVVRPLLKAPRGIIHNSFSPPHVMLRGPGEPGAPRLIDYETVALGAAQIDLAELLEAPAVQLEEVERLGFVAEYHRAMVAAGARQDGWPEFERVYHCAAIARSLDYAGTTALRAVQYAARGDAAGADQAHARRQVYLARARDALAALGEGDMARALNRLSQD